MGLTKPQNWFDVVLISPAMESLWRPPFRISGGTFDVLCDFLRDDLQKQNTRMRQPVSVEKRVAVGLWGLATGNSYRTCGLQFGLGKSTAKVISQEFESALYRIKNNYTRFPFTEDEVREAMDRFEELYNFPQTIGAIDGCHIEIKAPPVNKEDYLIASSFTVCNKELLTVNCIFVTLLWVILVVFMIIMQFSGISDLADNNTIPVVPVKTIQGVDLRPMLVGDIAYPLCSWLVKLFPAGAYIPVQEKI